MLSPNYILALLSRFSRCFLLHIFGAMSFIAPSFAQNTETGSNPEDNLDYLKVRLGFYVSGSGLVANVFPDPCLFIVVEILKNLKMTECLTQPYS